MWAAIYARKSTEQEGVAEEQKSVARQIENARSFAASRGWTVVDDHVFSDDGIGGAEFARRPGLIRLMAAVGRRAGLAPRARADRDLVPIETGCDQRRARFQLRRWT